MCHHAVMVMCSAQWTTAVQPGDGGHTDNGMSGYKSTACRVCLCKCCMLMLYFTVQGVGFSGI